MKCRWDNETLKSTFYTQSSWHSELQATLTFSTCRRLTENFCSALKFYTLRGQRSTVKRDVLFSSLKQSPKINVAIFRTTNEPKTPSSQSPLNGSSRSQTIYENLSLDKVDSRVLLQASLSFLTGLEAFLQWISRTVSMTQLLPHKSYVDWECMSQFRLSSSNCSEIQSAQK